MVNPYDLQQKTNPFLESTIKKKGKKRARISHLIPLVHCSLGSRQLVHSIAHERTVHSTRKCVYVPNESLSRVCVYIYIAMCDWAHVSYRDMFRYNFVFLFYFYLCVRHWFQFFIPVLNKEKKSTKQQIHVLIANKSI